MTAILAASTALFVGLGLGLQDAFKDLASGVIILMERTLSVGDVIQMGEQIGKVESVGLRTTAQSALEMIFWSSCLIIR